MENNYKRKPSKPYTDRATNRDTRDTRSARGVSKHPAGQNFLPGEKKPYRRQETADSDTPRRSAPQRHPSANTSPRDVYKQAHGRLPDDVAPSGEEAQETDEEAGAGLVIGRNAVRELLRSDRTVDKLLVRRGDREGSIVMLVAQAIENGIPVVEVDKSKLDDMAGFVPHQGVIAMVAQKEYCSVEDILAIAAERGEKPLIVIADGITDPYNLGALIRCAEGVGAHGLIIPRRRAVGLTALVAKASAGAMEHLAVAKVSNIASTIQMLQREGIWCFAAEAGGNVYYDTDFTGPCALVFGSEGNGVSRIVKEACDVITSIPMYGKVNSFNVSTAAAVILAEAARQHRVGRPSYIKN